MPKRMIPAKKGKKKKRPWEEADALVRMWQISPETKRSKFCVADGGEPRHPGRRCVCQSLSSMPKWLRSANSIFMRCIAYLYCALSEYSSSSSNIIIIGWLCLPTRTRPVPPATPHRTRPDAIVTIKRRSSSFDDRPPTTKRLTAMQTTGRGPRRKERYYIYMRPQTLTW